MAIPQQKLNVQEKIHRIVLTGMKFMYGEKTFPMLVEGIKKNTSMPQKLALEVAGIMKLIDQASEKGLPPETVGPASTLLLFELAQFMSQSGVGNPTDQDVKEAIQILRQVVAKELSTNGKASMLHATRQQQMQPPQPRGLIAQGA